MNRKRDIGQEILNGIHAIKTGKGKRHTVKVPDGVRAIRERMDLSQSVFAALLGVSLRTLQDWEWSNAGLQQWHSLFSRR